MGWLISKDPSILKWLHSNFARALAFLQTASLVIDADELSPDELVARIAAAARESAP